MIECLLSSGKAQALHPKHHLSRNPDRDFYKCRNTVARKSKRRIRTSSVQISRSFTKYFPKGARQFQSISRLFEERFTLIYREFRRRRFVKESNYFSNAFQNIDFVSRS
ncbi:hypothetical protein AVEN_146074-1 [Araneus ventricosus]|uniref:Uncharacterized protein n=1 Tax=Araneus ventricosus TaxID=182803 RepID=A0A4Y2F4S0_ARAVE|nr:hypothetical protein AVEN_146074-1 [Araneus ventricosus]